MMRGELEGGQGEVILACNSNHHVGITDTDVSRIGWRAAHVSPFGSGSATVSPLSVRAANLSPPRPSLASLPLALHKGPPPARSSPAPRTPHCRMVGFFNSSSGRPPNPNSLRLAATKKKSLRLHVSRAYAPPSHQGCAGRPCRGVLNPRYSICFYRCAAANSPVSCTAAQATTLPWTRLPPIQVIQCINGIPKERSGAGIPLSLCIHCSLHPLCLVSRVGAGPSKLHAVPTEFVPLPASHQS